MPESNAQLAKSSRRWCRNRGDRAQVLVRTPMRGKVLDRASVQDEIYPFESITVPCVMSPSRNIQAHRWFHAEGRSCSLSGSAACISEEDSALTAAHQQREGTVQAHGLAANVHIAPQSPSALEQHRRAVKVQAGQYRRSSGQKMLQ